MITLDTHLRNTTTTSYILEGQNRINEVSTSTYSQRIGADYVQISANERAAIKAHLRNRIIKIIRLEPTDELTVTPLENPHHRRVTFTRHRDVIFREFVKSPVSSFKSALNQASI